MNKFRALLLPLLVTGLASPLSLPPLLLALAQKDSLSLRAFIVLFAAALVLGAPAFILQRKARFTPAARDGFLLVFLTWIFMSAAGALPFMLAGGLSFTDAFFESAAGFATTGATVFTDIESLPPPLLLWRSLTHWAGGMGVILLTVALLPILGVGGFSLIKAESPGPDKEKLTAKAAGEAKILYLIYFSFTALLFLLYLSGGMGVFDAFCHAASTMASGGVSTKNSGLAAFASPFIENVTTIFMLLTGINYTLYYRLLRGPRSEILKNSELKAYLAVFAAATLVITLSLFVNAIWGEGGVSKTETLKEAFHQAAFHAASFISTSGVSISNYELWPPLAQCVLFLLLFTGGCSGSTASGIKIIRHVVLWKQTGNELRRLVYPRGVFSVQLNGRLGRKDVVYGVSGFIYAYAAAVTLTALACAACGYGLQSAFSTALALAGNTGLSFGLAGPGKNFADTEPALKWLFSFVMIAGRLELLTVFVLFTREWRRK